MTNDELKNVVGGTTSLLSGTFINSITRMVTTLLTLGRSVGSAINYYVHGKSCN